MVEQDSQVSPTGHLFDPLGGDGIGPILNPGEATGHSRRGVGVFPEVHRQKDCFFI